MSARFTIGGGHDLISLALKTIGEGHDQAWLVFNFWNADCSSMPTTSAIEAWLSWVASG